MNISELVKTQKISLDASKAIIVFPSYLAPLSGLPLVVERFIRSIDNIQDVSIIAVCNCGGYVCMNALPSLRKIRQIVRSCTGCGVCAKVCPADNIVIESKRPVFRHKCEICFACDEWCPTNSIHHWSRPSGVKYRHPDIRVADMIGDK